MVILLIDLEKYQEREFLISGIILAVGSILLIAFFVSFSIYLDSETKALAVNIKCLEIGNSFQQSDSKEASQLTTTTTPITSTTSTTTHITTTVPKTEFSVVFTTSKTRKTTMKKIKTETVNTTTQSQTKSAVKTNRPTTVMTTMSRRITTIKTKTKRTTTTKQTKRTAKVTTTTQYLSSDEKQVEILKLVNQKRKEAGLKKLKPMITLDNAALTRAKEISNSFSHIRPDGRGGETVLKDKKIEYSTYIENIGEGNNTAEEIFNIWWNSPAGKANILNKKVKYIGTACYYYPSDPNKYLYYWVQIFYC